MSATQKLRFCSAAALVSLAIALVVGGGAWRPAPIGLADAGPIVGWGVPMLALLSTGLGTFTVGWTGAAAWLQRPTKSGALTSVASADLRIASRLAATWMVVAIAGWWFSVADIAGFSLAQVLQPSVLAVYGLAGSASQLYLLVALLTMIIWLTATKASDRGAAVALAVLALATVSLPAFGGHSHAAGNRAVAVLSAVTHAAAAAAWVGGLAAFYVWLARDVTRVRDKAEAFGRLALVCVIALAATGVLNASVHLAQPTMLFTTGYGRLVVVKALLMIVLVGIAAPIRSRIVPRLAAAAGRGLFAKMVLGELFVMSVALGVGIALSQTPSP